MASSAGEPSTAGRPRVRALRSFRNPRFRRLWTGAVLEAFAMWLERLAVGWLILDVSDSVFLAAFSFAIRMAPAMLLGPIAGAAADRIERRRLLAVSSIARAAAIAGMALAVLTPVDPVWPVLALVAVSGAARTFQVPAEQALIVDLVGRRDAGNGVGLFSVGTRSVGVLGAVAGGVGFEVLGPSALFGFAAVLPLLAAATWWTIGPIAERRVTEASLWREVIEGVRVLAAMPVVATLLLLAVAVEILAFSYQSLLPGVAREVLGVGAAGLGVMTLAAGVGGIAGSAALSVLGDATRRGPLLLGVTLAFGVLLVLLGLNDRFPIALAVVAGIGVSAAMFDGLQWVLLQANVPDELRGRVIGAWMWAIGLGWLGPVTLGAIASVAGIPVALIGAGVAVALLATAAAAAIPRLRGA